MIKADCDLPDHVIIPVTGIKRMARFFDKLDGDDFVCHLDGKWLTLEHPADRKYFCKIRLIEGEYVNWIQVIPENFENTLHISAFAWRWMLDSVAVTKEMGLVTVKLEKPYVHFEAKSEDGGFSASNSYRMMEPYLEESVELKFNAQCLRNGLEMLKSDSIRFQYKNSFSPVMLESDDAAYVIMPMRSR